MKDEVERVRAQTAEVMVGLDLDALRNLIVDLVNIPSPTGFEAQLAEFVAGYLRDSGVAALLQPIDSNQANAVGCLSSRHGDGPDLLLYAPIDTHLSGDPEEDTPWSGEYVDPIRAPRAMVNGREVAGLGAENPKAYVACVIVATALLAAARLDLRGDVLVGLGAGGMPTNRGPANTREGVGQGAGVTYMLQQGVRADYAVIAKPVWAVSWEEVGVTWHRVRVKGKFGYSGLRHQAPYDNAIISAARVALDLEEWLPSYAAHETSGLVAPQGVIGAIRGGFTHKPTFVPAACDLFLDIRVSPRSDPLDVKRQLRAELQLIAARYDIDIDHEMTLAIPGSHTDPNSWIIRSMIRAWEHVEGRPHEEVSETSGATDVAILRMWGIPTGRLGIPYRSGGDEASWAGEDSLPMNLVHVDDCAKLIEALVYVAIDTCSRSLTETQSSERASR